MTSPMLFADERGKFRSGLAIEDRTPGVHHLERAESSTRVALACSCGAGIQMKIGDDERNLRAVMGRHICEATA